MMRSLYINAYGPPPKAFIFSTLPKPEIANPDEVLVKVYAASINPIDVRVAAGDLKMVKKDTFPSKIGYDMSGVVEGVGSGVRDFKKGDCVFARVPEKYKGTFSEYTVTPAQSLAPKPSSISHVEAASLPHAALTAYQSLLAHCSASAFETPSSALAGKSVFIPGALGGVGSLAVQLANNCLGASKVITAVSTGKMGIVKEKLVRGDDVVVVDYTKTGWQKQVMGVDLVFDSVGGGTSYFPLLKKPTGKFVSVTTLPSPESLVNAFKPDYPPPPRWMLGAMGLVTRYYRFWARWKGLESDAYKFCWMAPSGVQLRDISRWVEEGKIRPVVGRVVDFSDEEGVKRGFEDVGKGKVGWGKIVVRMVEE